MSNDIERVIVLGVNHRSRGHKAALSPWESWETPYGKVSVDRGFGESLGKVVDWLGHDERSHADEHSIEVQLPFLQRRLGDFSFVPISLAHISPRECAELGEGIARVVNHEKSAGTVILASSDLNHYLSPQETERRDRLAIARVLALDPAGLIEAVEGNDISMCGVLPTAVMLYATKALGAKEAQLLKHCHSGDIKPMREVVGYASVVVER